MLNKFVLIMVMFSWISVAQAADQAQPLTGDNLKQATEMNHIYARHMYSSTCVEKRKAGYTPPTLTPEEQVKRMEEFKASCDCVADTILKQFTPNDLIGYVGDMDGTFPPGLKVRPKPEPLVAQKYGKISAMTREIKARHQCGFKK